MADHVMKAPTIKDTGTNLADYDRMIREKMPIPHTDGVEDFTIEEWRDEWFPRWLRKEMARFKDADTIQKITRRVVSDTDVVPGR